MTSNSGARGFLSGRRGPLIGAVVVTALVVLVAFFMVWHFLGRDAWHEVRVVEARLIAPMGLELFIATCSAPRVSLWERDVDVQVSLHYPRSRILLRLASGRSKGTTG